MTTAPDTLAYFDKNSNTLVIEGLTNATTGALVTNLSGVTVTAQIYVIGSSTPITGGPITLSYLPDPDVPGSFFWAGVVPAGFAVTLGLLYEAEITADGGTSLRGVWRLRFLVQTRYVTWTG